MCLPWASLEGEACLEPDKQLESDLLGYQVPRLKMQGYLLGTTQLREGDTGNTARTSLCESLTGGLTTRVSNQNRPVPALGKGLPAAPSAPAAPPRSPGDAQSPGL